MIELFKIKIFQLIGAYFFDLLIGDPKRLPHPIVGIGAIIKSYETAFRKLPFKSEKLKGVLFFFAVIATTLSISIILTIIFQKFDNLLLQIMYIFIISQFLALKGLIDAGRCVIFYLDEGRIFEAREALKALVGRDTYVLDKKGIQRSILESYSENLSDGVIAPLFWLTILGFPGLVLYKTINTLDSMVGYKEPPYVEFGWFSARMDDLFNLIPSRLTALLIVLSATIYLGMRNGLRALRWTLRYAPLHPSPNSGYPEAALAGALGVRLLGPAVYKGKLINKPFLGEDLLLTLEPALKTAITLLYLSSHLGLIFFIIFLGVIL